MGTMKHTHGLALILVSLAAACGPTFSSGSPGVGDAALFDDDTADSSAPADARTDAGTADAVDDSGAQADAPVAVDAQPVDAGAVDTGDDAETDPWPPDGQVLGDPDVADAAADSGQAEDAGQQVDASVTADTAAPPDAARDTGDGGGAVDVGSLEALRAACRSAAACTDCTRIEGCRWCYNARQCRHRTDVDVPCSVAIGHEGACR